MDNREIDNLYNKFQQAYGRTLFAFNREKTAINNKFRSSLLDAKASANEKAKGVQLKTGQKLISCLEELKKQLSVDITPSHEILKVAEFLSFGNVIFPQLQGTTTLPFIVPFFGHGNLGLIGNREHISDALRNLLISVLKQTAPGQLQITAYNPDLSDTFSCFTGLDFLELYSDRDSFGRKLDSISKEIVKTDELLKGKYNSLIELRNYTEQAVGQLHLIVVSGGNWLSDEQICRQVQRLSEHAIRAGIVFIFSCKQSDSSRAKANLKKTKFLEFDKTNGYWRACDLRNTFVVVPSCLTGEISAYLDEYIEQSQNTTAVSIPFSNIESVTDFWTENSADGVSFSLGRVGLEKIELRLGDVTSQLHNVLITGAPGKGKSNLLEVMIHSMCCRYSPDELELYLLDFKDGLTFKPYSFSQKFSWLPHAKVLGLESARDFGVAVLEYIENERQRRAMIMNEIGAGSVSMYRQENKMQRMPRIVVVIDEYQKMLEVQDSLGTRAAELIENIVRQGRACGIHLILASQTVAHGAALMGREDQIYAAFPVRIGLQNNLQESYATFVQGNDAAAKLRVRGEAILNTNYGAIDSNQKFVVAYAEPNVMESLRKKWCQVDEFRHYIPTVFGKNDEFHLPDAKESLKQWRGNVTHLSASPMLLCGMSLSVDKEVVAVSMADNAGRNVAILGSGDGEKRSLDSIPSNYAIGLLENMAVTLALQHPQGDAQFVMINGIDSTVAKNNGIDTWLRLMERFGYAVEMVAAKDAPAFFVSLANKIKNHSIDDDTLYVFGFAMDRCPNMNESIGEDIFNTTSGAAAFQELLKSGPAQGVHIIAWWSNVAAYRDQIGFNGEGYIDTKILLRVDDATAKNVLGPFVTWQARANRLLLHDATDLQQDLTLIPMTPISIRDAGRMEAVVWE